MEILGEHSDRRLWQDGRSGRMKVVSEDTVLGI